MTIFSLLVDREGIAWIAATHGLWFGQPGDWQRLAHPLPIPPTILAQITDGSDWWQLLAAGPTGGIVLDAGRASWQPAWIDEVESPITCLVASPRFVHDRVLLAGTASAGVLRSIDSGRHWRVSNAGLDDLTVLTLATAPGWDERELVFGGTTRGLYRSPNGGRAWALCALPDAVLQAIVIAQTTIIVGTEQGHLYRSTDHAATWQQCWLPTTAPINGLWIDSGADAVVLAGTADGELLRSTDRGEHWLVTQSHSAAVLAIGGDRARLYAGCADDVLFVSRDAGATWLRDPSFAGVA